jgi:plasmid stabilization system protein ParE
VSLPVLFHSDARGDLEEVRKYFADRFSERNAEKYVVRIVSACTSIGHAPHRGSVRKDIGPEIRSIGFEGRITIIFRIQPELVTILALLYAGRMPR